MSGSLMVYLFASPSFAVFDDPEPASLDFRELWRLARSGFLMGLVAVSETGVFLASTIVIGLFAPNELIVHALTFRSIAICYLFVVGIGQAVTIRMAYLHARAAGNLEFHAKRAILSCALALVALVLVLLVLGAAPLGRLLASTSKASRSCRPHRNLAAHRRADAGRSDPGPHDHRPAQGAGGCRRPDRIHHHELLGDRADGHAAACRGGTRSAGRLAQPAPRRVRLVGLFFRLSLAAKREQAERRLNLTCCHRAKM